MRTDEDTIDDKPMPLLEHLLELRQRVLLAFGGFILSFIVCYIFSKQIYGFLAAPLANILQETTGAERRMIFTALYEAFFTYLKVALWGAMMISFPWWATQLWLFIAPGLYKSEKRAVAPFLIATPFFFAAGAAFCYYFVIPAAWTFFLSFESPAGPGELPIQLEAKVNEYLSLVMRLIFAFGFAFLMPVGLVLLCRVGIISPEGMAAKRRYAIVAMFVLAAVITPPDVISQVGLALPLILLYEGSIIAAKLLRRRAEAAQAS
jgi:sec-independent protein translocase protein TatC